jgi:hypothetical protein
LNGSFAVIAASVDGPVVSGEVVDVVVDDGAVVVLGGTVVVDGGAVEEVVHNVFGSAGGRPGAEEAAEPVCAMTPIQMLVTSRKTIGQDLAWTPRRQG